MSDSTVTTNTSYRVGGAHSGPFEYNGEKVYCVLLSASSSGAIEVWGASWYDESWSEEDSSGAPTAASYQDDIDCWFDGQYIHIVSLQYTGGPSQLSGPPLKTGRYAWSGRISLRGTIQTLFWAGRPGSSFF